MKTTKETGNAVNLIGKGTSIEGTIHSDSAIIIHGKIKGDIFCKATVTVGSDGVIDGRLEAVNAIVGGKISGSAVIKEKMVLEGRAAFYGDLQTSKLVIDEGAIFDGTSNMPAGDGKQVKGNDKSAERVNPEKTAQPVG